MKFNKFDRVEIAKDLEEYDLYEGEKGVVIGYNKEWNGYMVEFSTNRASLHDCDGYVPSKRGLYLSEKELRLA